MAEEARRPGQAGWGRAPTSLSAVAGPQGKLGPPSGGRQVRRAWERVQQRAQDLSEGQGFTVAGAQGCRGWRPGSELGCRAGAVPSGAEGLLGARCTEGGGRRALGARGREKWQVALEPQG